MVRRLIFIVAMLGAAQAHAGLFVFSGGDNVPFKLSLDRLEAVKENGIAVVRLSLRIEEVSKPVKSAGIRCNGESTSGGRRFFSGEIADLKVGEARNLVLDGARQRIPRNTAEYRAVQCRQPLAGGVRMRPAVSGSNLGKL